MIYFPQKQHLNWYDDSQFVMSCVSLKLCHPSSGFNLQNGYNTLKKEQHKNIQQQPVQVF